MNSEEMFQFALTKQADAKAGLLNTVNMLLWLSWFVGLVVVVVMIFR